MNNWWIYKVRIAGSTFPVILANEYEMSEFECRDAIKEAMRRFGITLTKIKMTR
jgi:hypothetical protein